MNYYFYNSVQTGESHTGLTASALIDPYREEPHLWDTNTQIRPHSVFSFCAAVVLFSIQIHISEVLADFIAQTDAASRSLLWSIKFVIL